MCSNNKLLVICFVHCLSCLLTTTCGFELNQLSNEAEIVNYRVKRDGGAIPFRPLFVYRQQQKEKQAKWKIEEARKLAQQNSIASYSKRPLYPIKGDYRRGPVYSSFPTTSSYRTKPTYQLYKNFEYYPENSYEIYQTDPDRSSLSSGLSYDNQQVSYYDQFDPLYYS